MDSFNFRKFPVFTLILLNLLFTFYISEVFSSDSEVELPDFFPDEKTFITYSDLQIDRLEKRTASILGNAPGSQNEETLELLLEDGKENPFSRIAAAKILEARGEHTRASDMWPEPDSIFIREARLDRLHFRTGIELALCNRLSLSSSFFRRARALGAARGKRSFPDEAAKLLLLSGSLPEEKGYLKTFLLEEALYFDELCHLAAFSLACSLFEAGQYATAAGTLGSSIKNYILDPRNLEGLLLLFSLFLGALLLARWIARLVVYLKCRKYARHEARERGLSFESIFNSYLKKHLEGHYFLRTRRVAFFLFVLMLVLMYPAVGGAGKAARLFQVKQLILSRNYEAASLLLDLEPAMATTYVGMFMEAVLKNRRGKPLEAANIYKKFTPYSPLYFEAQNNLALLELALKRPETIKNARERLEKIIANRPGFQIARKNLELMSGDAEVFEEAYPPLFQFFLLAFSFAELRTTSPEFWLWVLMGGVFIHGFSKKRGAGKTFSGSGIVECDSCGVLSCDLCRPSVDICPKCGEFLVYRGRPADGYTPRLIRKDRWRILIFSLLLPSFPLYVSGTWTGGFVFSTVWFYLIGFKCTGFSRLFSGAGAELQREYVSFLDGRLSWIVTGFYVLSMFLSWLVFRSYLGRRGIEKIAELFKPAKTGQ